MHATDPRLLDCTALAKRLHELAGDERNIQADFLLHLEAFDRKNGYLEAGYGSLWDFCLRALHLREGAAGRRIAAMRVLRRIPRLEASLRDGRLCLSTVALLAPVLTDENVDEVVAKAAYRTKAEVDHLVASLQPRQVPRAGMRLIPQPRAAAAAPVIAAPPEPPRDSPGVTVVPACAPDVPERAPELPQPATPRSGSMADAPLPAPVSETQPGVPAPREAVTHEVRRSAEVRAVSGREWSVRVTINERFKADLETLASLLSHKAGADLAAVLHEAIRCGIEKHGKRKGAVEPGRVKNTPPRDACSASSPRALPAAVRREVWKRDGGCCTWTGPDGRRCGSRWKLEIDHVRPLALGGSSDASNLRLLCARHNAFAAEQVFGREHMERFRRSNLQGSVPGARDAPASPPEAGEHGDGSAAPLPLLAREPAARWALAA